MKARGQTLDQMAEQRRRNDVCSVGGPGEFVLIAIGERDDLARRLGPENSSRDGKPQQHGQRQPETFGFGNQFQRAVQ